MTLNIAHGRKNGPNQFFQSGRRIKSNLDDIASLIRRERPDLAALQEADGPSVWSGGFNHVSWLAEKTGFTYSVRGAHVEGMKLSYGTALLSKYPLMEPVSITFSPSPPTFSKGFVSARIRMRDGSKADILSVHLDFARKSVRKSQAKDMIAMLSGIGNPLIIMGDFNCGWEEDSALRMLAKELNLSAYQPEAYHMITFPSFSKRLDWILISPELEFVSYAVLPDIVSDHLGVICEIRQK